MSLDNLGAYMLRDPIANNVVLGTRFDATPYDIEAYLRDDD
jgi:hypothetical protein